MKKIYLLITLVSFVSYSFSQEFPSPSNFEIGICYNNYSLGGSYCGPQCPQFATVHLYSFTAPETSAINSVLVEYNLYYENIIIATFPTTNYESLCSGIGNYYVTAVYANPAGESAPSNNFYAFGPVMKVSDLSKQNDISISPNPTTGIINIEFEHNTILKMSISDITGKHIIEKTKLEQNESVDLSSFKSGLYIIKIQTGNDVITKKIVKE